MSESCRESTNQLTASNAYHQPVESPTLIGLQVSDAGQTIPLINPASYVPGDTECYPAVLLTRIISGMEVNGKNTEAPSQFRHSSPRLRNHNMASWLSIEFTASLSRTQYFS